MPKDVEGFMAVNLQRIPFIAAARAQRPGILNPSRWLQGGRYLLLLIGVFCLLSMIVLLQTGSVATRGYEITDLEAQRDGLLRAQAQLQERQAQAQSLERVRVEAEKMGLGPLKPEQVRYLLIPKRLPAVGGPAVQEGGDE
jgi:hypothetical protein